MYCADLCMHASLLETKAKHELYFCVPVKVEEFFYKIRGRYNSYLSFIHLFVCKNKKGLTELNLVKRRDAYICLLK